MKQIKRTIKPNVRVPMIALIIPILFGAIFLTLGSIFILPNFGTFGIIWMIISVIIIVLPIVRVIYVNIRLKKGIEVTTFENVNTTSSVETRLKDLDDLYNKSLITKEEYESKRKDILNSL